MRKQVTIQYKGKQVKLWLNDPMHIKSVQQTGKFLENTMLERIEQMDLSHGIALDIGANCGNHTVFFGMFTNATSVWAFEPQPDCVDCIADNVDVNGTEGKTIIIADAVGDSIGEGSIFERGRSGIAQVSKQGSEFDIVPLDAHMANIPTVSLVKIDVEGMEAEALKGMTQLLNRDRPEMFVETSNPKSLLPYLPKGYRAVKRYNNSPTWHFTGQ